MQVIEKFGRFPHRNEIYKRGTTSLEATFLEDPTYRFDLPLVYGEDGSAKFDRRISFDLRKKMISDDLSLPKRKNSPRISALVQKLFFTSSL